VQWTLNPNYPLQAALKIIQPKCHIHWRVTTQPLFGMSQSGHVTNIPFEERKSKVTAYWADYWLLSKDDPYSKGDPHFDYLAYTQTVLMEMDISLNGSLDFERYVFPHVTSNTVKKVPGTPTQARHALPSP
jgi:hypothetical protein